MLGYQGIKGFVFWTFWANIEQDRNRGGRLTNQKLSDSVIVLSGYRKTIADEDFLNELIFTFKQSAWFAIGAVPKTISPSCLVSFRLGWMYWKKDRKISVRVLVVRFVPALVQTLLLYPINFPFCALVLETRTPVIWWRHISAVIKLSCKWSTQCHVQVIVPVLAIKIPKL